MRAALSGSPCYGRHDRPACVQNGKTKFTIENATRTRIVLADTRIHILGSYQNIRIARDAICALIMGSPPVRIRHRHSRKSDALLFRLLIWYLSLRPRA